MKKALSLLLVLVLLTLCFAGCAKSTPAATTAPSPSDSIKIGLIFSLTGATAITEECMYNSAVLAIDEINAAAASTERRLNMLSRIMLPMRIWLLNL